MQEANRASLDGLVDRYLEEKRGLAWCPHTIESDRSHLRVFTSFLAAETDVEGIEEVTPGMLRRYQPFLCHWTDRHERGRSFATQRAWLSAVCPFLRNLVRTEVLAHDPASTLLLPKRRRILPRSS